MIDEEYRLDLLELMLENWEFMKNHEPNDWPYEELLDEIKSLVSTDRWALKVLRDASRTFHWREEE